MLYNLFLPRGVCHTATAIAVIDYVCTTNLRCLVINFMVFSRSQCVMTLRPSERSELFSADLALSNQ